VIDVMQAVDGLKQHLEAFAASAKEKLEQELPVIAGVASALAGNPVVAALAAAEHLNQVPEYLATFAELITKADQALGAAKAAAAQPPAEPPADQPPV